MSLPSAHRGAWAQADRGQGHRLLPSALGTGGREDSSMPQAEGAEPAASDGQLAWLCEHELNVLASSRFWNLP